MNANYVDLATRAGWTGAQASLSLLVVGLADIPTWWAAPLALSLSALKTWVVGHSKVAA